MTLLGFPLDSTQVGYHDDGFPAYSNEYTSGDYRLVLSKLISNGVIGEADGNRLKVVAANTSQKTCRASVFFGSAVVNGCLLVLKDQYNFDVSAPSLSGSETSRTKTTYVYIGFDAPINYEKPRIVKVDYTESGLSIKEEPTTYHDYICLGRIVSRTTLSGSTYSYQHSVTDLRASEYCGWAAPFVDVDTSAYYDAVQQVVDESKAEVEATIPTLLENAQESVDSAISNLEEQTQNAIDLAQNAIEGTVAGELDSRLDAIEDGVPALLSPTVEIPPNANLNDYTEPGCYFCKAENTLTLTNRPMTIETTDLYMWVIKQPITENSNYAYVVTQFALYGGGSYTVNFSRREVDIKKDGTKSGSTWYVYLHNHSNLSQYLGVGSITTDKIQNLAITTQKLADNSVTEDKLDSSLNELLSQNFNWVYPVSGSSGIRYTKVGRIVFVSLFASITFNATGGYTLFTLPVGYRPVFNVTSTASVNGKLVNLHVSPEGVVRISSESTGTHECYSMLSYPV